MDARPPKYSACRSLVVAGLSHRLASRGARAPCWSVLRRRIPRCVSGIRAAARSQRSLDDATGRLHEPALALERLAVEPGDEPIGEHRRREWTEVGRRYAAHGVPAVGIDHQLARAGHGANHALAVLERAEL